MNKILIICFMASLLGQSLSAQQNSCDISTPAFVDFNSNPWIVAPTGVKKVDSCWTFPYTPGNQLYWDIGTPRDSYWSSDSSGFILFDYYIGQTLNTFSINSSSKTEIATVVTPKIDIAGMTKPTFSFEYYMYGNNIKSLRIYAQLANTWQPLDSLVGEHQFSQIERFKKHEIPLPIGDKISLKFEAVSDGGLNSYMAVDNFRVAEDSCASPNRPFMVNIGQSTATLRYEERNPGGQVQVVCGIAGKRPGKHFMSFNALSNTDSVVISGLEEGVFYEAHLRAICGNDTGAWLQPLPFTTQCEPVKAFPYFEDFNDWLGDTVYYYNRSEKSRGKLSACWTGEASSDTSYNWFSVNSGRQFSDYPQWDGSGGQGVFVAPRFFQSPFSTMPQPKLVSPVIDLSQSVRPELRFLYHSHDSVAVNQLFVEVLQNESWQRLAQIQTPSQGYYSDPWEERTIDLSAFKDSIQIRFYPENANQAISLDNFSIAEKPGCALAGKDTTINVCDTIAHLNLNQFLPTGADTAGYWVDIDSSGALYGSDSLATVSLTNDVAYKFQFAIPADSNCTADSAVYTIIRNKLGCTISVKEVGPEKTDFEIYPNPSNGLLHIIVPDANADYNLLILNNQGKMVVKHNLAGQDVYQLELNLPSGLYYCVFKSEDGFLNSKTQIMIQ